MVESQNWVCGLSMSMWMMLWFISSQKWVRLVWVCNWTHFFIYLFFIIYYLFDTEYIANQIHLDWSWAESGFGNKWVQLQTQTNLAHFLDKMNHSINQRDMDDPQTQICYSTILNPFYSNIAQLRPQLKPAQKQN